MGPSARYRQHPAVVTAPFVAPGRFVGEQCVAAAQFGGPVKRNVLHVFDKGTKMPDVPQLATQVSGVLVGISGAPAAPGMPTPELPSYGVPIPAPSGSSASSTAAVGAADGIGGGLSGLGGAGGAGGAAPDAAAAGASGSSGRRK